MVIPFVAIILGLVLMLWSADRFIEGAAVSASKFGVSSLMIGMVVVGFGTSAPEIVVATLASLEGSPELALGNAYGSNIANIALILGVTALLSPILVHARVMRKDVPILIGVTALSAWLVRDGDLSRIDGAILLGLFAVWMGWVIVVGKKENAAAPESEKIAAADDLPDIPKMSMGQAVFWLVLGAVLLVASSRMLVWGAVEIAQSLGVSDLVIGLTIVGVGTSLPELASSVAAVRKGEDDIALGNVLGSNVFNTLAVVGIAGAIHPMDVAEEVLRRDVFTMGALTLLLLVFGIGFRGPGRITRVKGFVLLLCYAAYTGYVAYGAIGAAG